MYVGRDFDFANAAESEVFALDFSNDIADDDAIAGSSWTCTVQSGTDASAASRLVGTPFTYSSTISAQRVAGLLPGVTYILTCTVTTLLGNTVVLWSRVRGEVVY